MTLVAIVAATTMSEVKGPGGQYYLCEGTAFDQVRQDKYEVLASEVGERSFIENPCRDEARTRLVVASFLGVIAVALMLAPVVSRGRHRDARI